MPSPAEFATAIRTHRQALLADWRARVRRLPTAQGTDVPTLNDHVLQLIDQLADALELGSSPASELWLRSDASPAHGQQRPYAGFDIEEVGMELNILRACLHRLGEQTGEPLQGEVFHVVNQHMSALVAASVRAYVEESKTALCKEQDRLLAFVAHDLRTPLNAISVALDLLEQKKSDPALSERMTASMRRNVQRLKSLVNQVLEANVDEASAPAAQPHPRLLELRQVVQACILALEPVASKSGAGLVNAVPELLTVHADPTWLARVLQNLVANALGHARSSRIVIGAEAVAGGRVDCFVADQGSGVTRQRGGEMVRDDDRSSRTGHGLGLAIVKQLVEAHGGQLSIESEAGHGTTFRFDLPRDGSG